MKDSIGIRQFVLAGWLAVVPLALQAEISITPAWTEQTGSASYGGVTVDDARVYVGSEDGRVHAFSIADGKKQWTHDAGADVSSAAAVDDLRVYFHTRAGRVIALDRASGELSWSFETGGERRWDYWDFYISTPAVDDRQIYFGSGDHHVYALDKRSGELRWKFESGGIVHGEPLISGEKILVGGFDGRFHAIDRGNGRLIWSFKTVGHAYFRNGELPGSATARDGLVYFGGRDYNIYAVLEDTGTGAWNERTPSWIVGRPLVAGNDLVIVNSDQATVISYNKVSGQENWRHSNTYNMFAGAEAVGDQHIAVASLDGSITILSRTDGSVAARYETDGSRSERSSYFNDDGSVDYSGLRSLDDLMVFYGQQMTDMDGIAGRIVVRGNRIYYATVGGEVAVLNVEGLPEPAAAPEQ